MKNRYILITMLVISLGAYSFYPPERSQPNFNTIWSTGYVDGWCYDVEGHCIEPITPIPPLPRIKDTTYTIIYNRGFLAGRRANYE